MDWVICRIHENVRRNKQDHHSILLLNNEDNSIDPTTMAMDLDSENPRVEDMAIVAGEESQPYYAGNSYDYVAAYPEYMQQPPLEYMQQQPPPPPPLEYMQQQPPLPQDNAVVEIPQLDYYYYSSYTNNNGVIHDNSTEYGSNPNPQNNDFGGYYYTGELLSDSIQSACPSQSQTTTEALESMANREGTPNWNMLPPTRTTPPAASQDAVYADDSIMHHHTLQNTNNNTTVDAIIDDDAEFQSFLEDALSFLPPIPNLDKFFGY